MIIGPNSGNGYASQFHDGLWQQWPLPRQKFVLAYYSSLLQCYSVYSVNFIIIIPQFNVVLWHHRSLTTVQKTIYNTMTTLTY